MKHNFTFAEAAKIFAQVDKVDSAVRECGRISNEYEDASAAFDKEFAKYGYNFHGAPEELHTMFDVKCRLMDGRDKAERKAYSAIKEFARMIGICEGGYLDYDEDRIKAFIDRKMYFLAPEIAEKVKCLAMGVARKINMYA